MILKYSIYLQLFVEQISELVLRFSYCGDFIQLLKVNIFKLDLNCGQMCIVVYYIN